jgi:hypothetical protein
MAQTNYKGPLDYIDVATRIVEFREKYPEGSLRQVDLQFIDFAGKSWVVYTAAAYRYPEDTTPGMGTAWEPVPGPTPYTRDSEVQNAETAAWGRAMVASLAVDTRKGVASAEEVRNREQKTADPVAKVNTPATDWNALTAAATNRVELLDLFAKAKKDKAPKAVLDAITAKGKSVGE